MTKVVFVILVAVPYEGSSLKAVFATEKLAQVYCRKNEDTIPSDCNFYIQKEEVREE